ncbi:MAG: alkene reductase [Planctomyces sp.]|nr:alkene reductase [Planctomyces sp.]
MPAPDLFSPVQLGLIHAPNRALMAPMTRCRASTGGVPNPLNAAYYAQRASAGLIISEATMVSPLSLAYPNIPGIFTTAQTDGWRLVTDAVHRAGGRIVNQLWHAGRTAHPDAIAASPVAPSPIAAKGNASTADGPKPHATPRALETGEVPLIVEQFRAAALNAKLAGFDGVELHAANGYLLDQFLRDGTNRRTDSFGGTAHNRARLVLQAAQAAVDVWGPGRVGVRFSPSGTFNDMSDSDPRATFSTAVTLLDALPLAYVHIYEADSADIRHGATDPVPVGYFRQFTRHALVVNGQYTLDRARDVLGKGHADAVAFGKPFIANPDLPRRLQAGAPLNTPNPETFYAVGAVGYTDYPALP